MTKHTPGPWFHERGMKWVHEEATGATIARVEEDDGHCDKPRSMPQEANARLIAAAPDLLAACEAIFNAPGELNKLVSIELPDGRTAAQVLESAILKARGHQ